MLVIGIEPYLVALSGRSHILLLSFFFRLSFSRF
jgi:hypothetical protein